MTKKIGIQIRMHQPALAELRAMSLVRGLPAAELIRRAVDEFLANQRGIARPRRIPAVFERSGSEANVPVERDARQDS